MTLLLILKVLGWMFTLIPLAAHIVVSVKMIQGVGKDDPLIPAIALIGLTMFLMGLTTLIVVYFTDYTSS